MVNFMGSRLRGVAIFAKACFGHPSQNSALNNILKHLKSDILMNKDTGAPAENPGNVALAK
jgi:hypothetical protein